MAMGDPGPEAHEIVVGSRVVASLSAPPGWVVKDPGDDVTQHNPDVVALYHPKRGWFALLEPHRGQLDLNHSGQALFEAIMEDGFAQVGLDAEPISNFSVKPHDALGLVVHGDTSFLTKAPSVRLEVHFGLLNVNRGVLFVTVTGRSGTAKGAEVLLDALELTAPPLDLDTLGGHRTSSCGFEIDLPEGWRELARGEYEMPRERLSGTTTHHFTNRTSLNEGFTCHCQPDEDLSDVIDPALYAEPSEVFKQRVKHGIAGQNYAVSSQTGRKKYRTVLSGQAVELQGDGELSIIELGDRQGYLWHVPGMIGEIPVETAHVFTSWGQMRLDCTHVVSKENVDSIQAFNEAAHSLRVTNGSESPQQESLFVWYKKRWPFQHALLQLPVVGGVFLLLCTLLLVWWARR